MNTTRTATQRIRRTAAGLVLGGALMSLAACGGSSTTEAGGSSSDTSSQAGPVQGIFQGEDRSEPIYLQIDGDQAILTRSALQDEDPYETTEAAEAGEFDQNADYIDDIGTVNDDQTAIVWQSGDDSTLSLDDSMAVLDDDPMLPFDSDQAKAQRDEQLND